MMSSLRFIEAMRILDRVHPILAGPRPVQVPGQPILRHRPRRGFHLGQEMDGDR